MLQSDSGSVWMMLESYGVDQRCLACKCTGYMCVLCSCAVQIRVGVQRVGLDRSMTNNTIKSGVSVDA